MAPVKNTFMQYNFDVNGGNKTNCMTELPYVYV